MDRWALSLLGQTIRTVTERLDAYDVTAAGRAIGDFVDELSNWYVRRSRRRFWKGEDDLDKKAAHSTLYECLVAVAKLTAPFTPFVAESIYQNLVVNVNKDAPESVHLADWPEPEDFWSSTELLWQMAAARRVVALGRAARNAAAIKTRQPLREVVVAPDFSDAHFEESITLSPEELLVEAGGKAGYALERDRDLAVAVATQLDEELAEEGIVRELVHKVQNLRREKGFEIEEGVRVGLSGSPRITGLLEGRWGEYFRAEVLARELDLEDGGPDGESLSVDGEVLTVRIEPTG
jgi:leucyl-tRNA synthetase